MVILGTALFGGFWSLGFRKITVRDSQFENFLFESNLKVKYAIVNLAMKLNIMLDKFFVTKNMIIMALLLAGIENVLLPNDGRKIIWARK